jgi:hypothetical protein
MARVQYNGAEYEIVDYSVEGFAVFNWYVYTSSGFDSQGAENSRPKAVRAARDRIDELNDEPESLRPEYPAAIQQIRDQYCAGTMSQQAAYVSLRYLNVPENAIPDILNCDLEPQPIKPDPVYDLPDIVFPHTMYDCETGIAYQANSVQEHMAMIAQGYVHDLSECKTKPPDNGGGNGGGNGIEIEGGILNTAGIFVVGAAKGTLIATIPIISMAVAVGFMRRIVRFGAGVAE